MRGTRRLDAETVQCGYTSCTLEATAAARVRIMTNINAYVDLIKATCVGESEVEGAIMDHFGELPSEYVPRVTGVATGRNRKGLINDFAAYTANTPFQVMVIDTGEIWSDATDQELQRAVRKAEFRTDVELVKCRFFCVVMNKEHYDLGVVRFAESTQAVFSLAEWEFALGLILAFVKSKSPVRGSKDRSDLCARWVPFHALPTRESRGHREVRVLKEIFGLTF